MDVGDLVAVRCNYTEQQSQPFSFPLQREENQGTHLTGRRPLPTLFCVGVSDDVNRPESSFPVVIPIAGRPATRAQVRTAPHRACPEVVDVDVAVSRSRREDVCDKRSRSARWYRRDQEASGIGKDVQGDCGSHVDILTLLLWP